MTTDTSEKGLETLIVEQMTGRRSTAPPLGGMARDPEPFENGGAKVVHGSGGILARCGRSKTLPPVAFDPFRVGRWKDVHRGALFTCSSGLPC